MNRSKLTSVLFAALSITALGLTACDKPTVVNVPAETIVVPGPAGAPGEPGRTGDTGDTGVQGNAGKTGVQGDTGETGVQGEAGKTGDSTTIIVTPPTESN